MGSTNHTSVGLAATAIGLCLLAGIFFWIPGFRENATWPVVAAVVASVAGAVTAITKKESVLFAFLTFFGVVSLVTASIISKFLLRLW